MSLALLFPGQGVQHAAMLPWLQHEDGASAALAMIAGRLGSDWRDRLCDEDWACGNVVAQTLITGVSLAAWSAVAAHLPSPVAVAGYSVGELAACCAAGVFDLPTALTLAHQRALAMDACAGTQAQGLMAVTGASVVDVESLCERFDLAMAIRIDVDRCVVGGTRDALQTGATAIAALGAETTPLRVRVASHTAKMTAAARAFATSLEPLEWHAARCVIANDLDGAGRRDPLSLKHALARQVDHTVLWDRCMDTVAERRPRCVLEAGPGSSLSRMWSARHPEVPIRSLDEFRSAAAVVDWVRRELD